MPNAAPVKQEKVKSLELEKIRPERNLEKWSLWSPASSKNPPRARVIEREITLPNGDKAIGRLKIGFTDQGELTTEDQRTYYALVKHWELNGRPATTPFSLKKLTKLLKKKWGTRNIETLTESLARLYATPLFWTNAYHDSASGKTHESLEGFRVLDSLKIIKTRVDGHITKEAGYFKFNELILSNLQNNHTKPVLFDVVLGFKSEIAQLIYTHIDLILAGNTFYERKTIELFADLGISGKTYKFASKRKQALDPALKELQGVPLSKGGVIASATLERTKDNKDYKVVFRKGSARKVQEAPTADPLVQEESRDEEESQAQPYQKQLTPQEEKGAELVAHFYRLFHQAERHKPSSKERDQATSLIAQYGETIARFIVDYSHKAAPTTNYKPQTFGGIIQYAARAAAEYERKQKEKERRQQAEAEAAADRRREAAEATARERAQERYNRLPEADRQTLIDAYTEKLCEETPMWAEHREKGTGSLLNSAVRAAILEDFTSAERGESDVPTPPPQE